MKNLNNFHFRPLKKKIKKILGVAITTLFFLFTTALGQEDVSLTVTNNNLALVKEKRTLQLNKGKETVNISNIPSQIIPTSVLVEQKKNSFFIMEQNYEYDLINSNKILEKSIDQEIIIIQPDQGIVKGKLLSSSGANIIVLDKEDNLQIIPKNNEQKIMLANYSQKTNPYRLKPSLKWIINAQKAGKSPFNLSYLTNGLNWNADYVAKLNESSTKIKLSAWVTVTNNSGRTFKNTQLKLLAGDISRVHRIAQPMAVEDYAVSTRGRRPVEEKTFFEYHLYTIPEKTTLNNNSIKQIQFLNTIEANINIKYQINSSNAEKTAVIIQLNNTKANGLGIPLPKGIVRVYKADEEDLEFVGEDNLKHTPKEEAVEIKVGNAFDISSERVVKKTSRPTRRSQRSLIEYIIKNHKEEDVNIEIHEILYPRHEYEILESNIKAHRKTAQKIIFIVPVKANSKKTLTFELLDKY
jgi:hypothetical protein